MMEEMMMEEMMKQCCGEGGKPNFEKMKEFMGSCGKTQFSENEIATMRAAIVTRLRTWAPNRTTSMGVP